MRGEVLESAAVGTDGIPGDRAGAFFAREGARAGKPYRGKENDRLHLFTDADAAGEAARARGDAVELRAGSHFFDDAPLSIVLDAWLRDLSAHVGYDVEWERFRPNFFVRAAAGVPREEELTGAELQLGSARLRVCGPIERCVAITYHPRGEPSDPRILRYLAQERSARLGIYCDVLQPGLAARGDELLLLEKE